MVSQFTSTAVEGGFSGGSSSPWIHAIPRGVADDGGPRDWHSGDAVQAMRGLWSVHREVLRRLPRCSSSTRRGVGGWAIDAPVLLVRQQACLLPLLQETFFGFVRQSGGTAARWILEWPGLHCFDQGVAVRAMLRRRGRGGRALQGFTAALDNLPRLSPARWRRRLLATSLATN